MKNSIDAHLEFSFKGETHALSATIDLDRLPQDNALPSIHALLARQGGIDTYSYQYEIMQEEDIRFDNPHGLAAEFLQDGHFDLAAFAERLRADKLAAALQSIAEHEMGIADLEQHPQLKNSLLQAYRLGEQAS